MGGDANSPQYGPIKITGDPASGLTSIEFLMQQGDTLVAVLSPDEMERIQPLFQHIEDHLTEGVPATIDLRAAFLDLIGRDPFEGQ